MTETPSSDSRTRVFANVEPVVQDHPPTMTAVSPRRTSRVNQKPLTMTTCRGSEPIIPGYRILARLGRGGMGVVYRAAHLALNRSVALKILGGSAYEIDPENRARFRKEAEALASLRHTNIVPVYEVGESDGLPFFTMELVEGGDLATLLRTAPPKPMEAARIALQLAHGVQAAHDAGIIHRDLKPSNILLKVLRNPETGSRAVSDGESLSVTPMIADFGLAKRFGFARGFDTTVTQKGDILGTPSYMSPEQAEGHGSTEIGPSADIYALGAILYEMLAKRPPFEAEDPVRTVLQVLNEEPTPIAKIASGVPRDLETICLKCLQKDARKRYATAGELAGDLERFISGRPIVARPVSTPERVWKWARRRPAIAGMLATTALAVIVAFVGITTLWIQANHRAARESAALELAKERELEIQRQAYEMELRLARGYLDRGIAACQTDHVARGLIYMAHSLEMIERLKSNLSDPASLRHLNDLEWAVRGNLSHWEHKLPLRKRATFLTPDPGGNHWTLDVDISPDGSRLVSGSRDGYLRLINAETNEDAVPQKKFDGAVQSVQFSPDGNHFLIARHDPKLGDVSETWRTADMTRAGPSVPIHGIFIERIRIGFSNSGFCDPNVIFVQSSDRAIRFLKAGTDEQAAPAIEADAPITNAQVVPETNIMVTGHLDGSLRKWDWKTGKLLAAAATNDTLVMSLTVSPDGKRIASGHRRGYVRVFDTASMTQSCPVLRTEAVTEADETWFGGFLYVVRFGPDSRTLAAGGGLFAQNSRLKGFLQTWDVEKGTQLDSFEQSMPVWDVGFKGDGSAIVSAAEDCTIRVYSTLDGKMLHQYLQAGNPARVVVGRDGRTIFAADRGSSANPMLADLGPSRLAMRSMRLDGGRIRSLRFRPDGSLTAIGGDRVVRHLDPRSGEDLSPELPIAQNWYHFRLSPEGNRFYAWQEVTQIDKAVSEGLVDFAGRKPIKEFRRLPTAGIMVMLPENRGMISIPIGGTPMRRLDAEGNTVWEHRFADRSDNSTYMLGDVTADGKTIVVATRGENLLRFFDGETGQPDGPPVKTVYHVENIGVNPARRAFVVGFSEGFLQEFDLDTRQPIGPAISWQGERIDFQYAPDGRTLCAFACKDHHQTFYRFDVVTGVNLGPTESFTKFDQICAYSFNAEGHTLATGSHNGKIEFHGFPGPMNGSAAQVRCYIEMITRTELIHRPTEATRALSDQAVGERRKRLRVEFGGEPAMRTSFGR